MSAADSEDEDVKRAIALSLAESSPKGAFDEEPNTSTTAPPAAPSTMSLLGLNRKAMEEERLARQAKKRERSITPPAPSSRKAPKLDTDTTSFPSGAQLRTFSTTVQGDQKERKSAAANAANDRLRTSGVPSKPSNEGSAGIKYPRGVVKKTWAFGYERTGDDIKLEEVLETNTLKTAVLSAFQWDMDWVLGKLKTPIQGGKTKCVFIMQAKEAELRKQMLEETEPARSYLRLCFPPMEGQTNCMHSKLMLLFHPDKMRIAIPTANLLDFDWGESGVMENSVFVLDLPRRETSQCVDDLTAFGKELVFFLEKQGLDEDVLAGVLKFDFSATVDMAFVHAIGGILHGTEAQRTGVPGLARAVRHLNLQTASNLQIDFAASSIGSLNDDFLRSVHSAARGTDMITQSAEAAVNAKNNFFKGSSKPEQRLKESIEMREKLRIYFPTYDTVRASNAGAVGTICLSRKWFEAHNFPRSCFREYTSTRKGLLSHNKILYARGHRLVGDEKSGEDAGEAVAWAYVGSANMSESAWGKLVLDKKTKQWRVNCRNWECGVLLPVRFGQAAMDARHGPGGTLKEVVERDPDETESEDEEADGEKKESAEAAAKAKAKIEDSETESEDDGEESTVVERPKAAVSSFPLPNMDVFNDRVKPPFELPGKLYEGKEPWYFKEWPAE
ncbi:hypothetical protein MBLNU230_g4523t1 [Neophaeotheca triangularis]